MWGKVSATLGCCPLGCCLSAALTAFALTGVGQDATAIEPENVLVIYNADEGEQGDGARIANHYQMRRPGVHVAPIFGASFIAGNSGDPDQVSARDYLNLIRPQVLNAITTIPDEIDVIVTTKGLPLRINANSPGRTDQFAYSSLESELARIDEIDQIIEMRDQTVEVDLGVFTIDLPPKNPYYREFGAFVPAAPFSHTGSDPLFNDIRLTSRLDGKTVEQVTAAIDRAQDVFIVPTGQYVIADDDPFPVSSTDELVDVPGQSGLGPGRGLVGRDIDSDGEVDLPGVLDLKEQAYLYNNTNEAITTAPGSVIGYVSHGANDDAGGQPNTGLMANYMENGQLQFDLADGAVFHSFESNNASDFNNPNSQGQGQVADWLEIGGTAGVGNVREPLNGFENISNEDLFYDSLLPAADAAPGESGLTFVEAAWGSIRQLSYVNTVVGDPLMTFRAWLPGDFNLDGSVDLSDFFIMGQNFGQPGGFAQGDANNDGVVDLDDFFILGGNFGQSLIEQPGSSSVVLSTPEPGAGALAAAAVAACIGRVRRRRAESPIDCRGRIPSVG